MTIKRLLGSAPSQVSTNKNLGGMAFQDAADVTQVNVQQTTNTTNEGPSLLLDFANSKTLDPRITFSRPTTATYYNGITSAVAEQNLQTYSQDFTNVIWGKVASSIALTALTTAPDGNSTADIITSSATSYTYTFSNTTTTATAITFSVYIKAGTNSYVAINLQSSPTIYATAVFGLASAGAATQTGSNGTGVSITSSSSVDAGNGWYRCSLSIANTSALSMVSAVSFCGAATGNTIGSYGIIGAGITSGNTLYLWGAQLENRSAATAYNATTTTALTNYIPVLQTAASGVARFDCNPTTGESLGLLIEEQRTNVATYNSAIGGTNWLLARTTVALNQNIAPDGSLTATVVTEDTNTNSHAVYQAYAPATATNYSLTFYMKAKTRTFGFISFYGGITECTIFNLSNGTITYNGSNITSSSITSVGNGWYRCTTTFLTTSAAGFNFQVGPTNSGSAISYTGDGLSGIYAWGAQLEAGAFPTSYIPTVASQVTRSGDAANMTGTNFSSWYNQSQGSIFANIGYSNGGSFPYVFSIQSLDTERNYLVKDSSSATSATPFSYQISNASNTITLANISQNSTKFGLSYFANGTATSVSDITSTTSATLKSVPIATSLQIGYSTTYGRQMNGTLKKLAYYPVQLSSGELQEMTA